MSTAFILCPAPSLKDGLSSISGFIRIDDIDTRQLETFIGKHCLAPDGRYEHIENSRGWFSFTRTRLILTQSGVRQEAAQLTLDIRDSFPGVTEVSIH